MKRLTCRRVSVEEMAEDPESELWGDVVAGDGSSVPERSRWASLCSVALSCWPFVGGAGVFRV